MAQLFMIVVYNLFYFSKIIINYVKCTLVYSTYEWRLQDYNRMGFITF